MKVIQFTCTDPEISEPLKALMLRQINTWSRLSRLATDPAYVTEPFGPDTWRTHTTTPGLHWADWGSIYANLGDDGRAVADQMFGDGPLQGILRFAPLVQAMPNMRIQIVDVADPVAAGYIAAPEEP